MDLSGGHPLIVGSRERELMWPDESATQAFATSLAAKPAISNATIELHGDLGAGKTSFVRHLLRALGVAGRIKSPSYAVVEPYSLAFQGSAEQILNIWHFDLYRFTDPREFEEAGFRDLLASPGLKLIEWPEKAQGALPQPDLALHIRVMGDDSRQVRLQAFSACGQELIA